MKLAELLEHIEILESTADPALAISGISYDSRKTKPGDLFVAIKGFEADGHRFIPKAMANGAAAVLCEDAPTDGTPYVKIADCRQGLAFASRDFYGDPASRMKLVGFTGTSGKTSSTYILKHVLETKLGAKVGLIGTNGNMIGERLLHTEHTTPESLELHRLFKQMTDEGCTHVVMEVSSHSLELRRVAGVDFDVAVFTNLSQDHLDYHKTFENYLNAKKQLFSQCEIAIINRDDPYAERIQSGLTCPVFTTGIRTKADYSAANIDIKTSGVRFLLRTPTGESSVQLHISGLFSIYNAMGAAALMQQAGFLQKDIVAGLESLSGVAGRLQSVDTNGMPFSVYIDYAHTPDALENVLNAVRAFSKGRVLSLFGCGGDRDRAKRPLMGEIGGRHSDYVIVTSDNPRSEDPQAIVRTVEEGVRRSGTPYAAIVNRRDAIAYALSLLEPDDILVIAGKGHENYQEINGVKYHFDDKEIVEELLRQ